ncbi:MAG: tRNA-dihydrouridine synthase C [Granulosicoccus sp.]|jgi:tRNA-dihydrouridine synthase C
MPVMIRLERYDVSADTFILPNNYIMYSQQSAISQPVNKVDKIVLAPMEGVIDAPMRRLLTGIGGYTRCVTEFVRVTDVLLPEKVFLRFCPELESGGVTESGIPVYTQLLGSDAKALALNAVRAAQLGAPGIDLNFGCPAKTVNNSMGGSILLRTPSHVAMIVDAVRNAVPSDIPVTAKIRLGYDDSDLLADIVGGIRDAGATELAIHARTKFDGYKPPAWWATVSHVVPENDLTTYINGEIWTVKDSVQARGDSGCTHIMLGRGALAAPDLALRIAAASSGKELEAIEWLTVSHLVEAQFLRSDCLSPRHIGNRTKQWLAYLKRSYDEAQELFTRLRTLHDVSAIQTAFAEHRVWLRDLSAG